VLGAKWIEQFLILKNPDAVEEWENRNNRVSGENCGQERQGSSG
jgi:hypothetical protein